MTPDSAAVATIVMVTYNCEGWVDRCLGSIPGGARRHPVDVIVIDNASTDRSADNVACHIDVRLVRNEHNVGFGAAVNQGAALTDTPIVILLNPDTEVQAGSIDALIDFAQRNPGHGLYGGRTLRRDGSNEPSSCWALPTLWSTACFALGLSTAFRGSPLFDPESMGGWKRDTVREVDMITGCLLLAPRSVWDELRGFDERYFVYGEDADLAARARALGYRPIMTPDAVIVHEVGVSSSNDGAKTVLLLAGKMTYAQTHWSGPSRWTAVQLLRLGVGVRAAGARLSGRGKKWLHAWNAREQWWSGFPPTQISSGARARG